MNLTISLRCTEVIYPRYSHYQKREKEKLREPHTNIDHMSELETEPLEDFYGGHSPCVVSIFFFIKFNTILFSCLFCLLYKNYISYWVLFKHLYALRICSFWVPKPNFFLCSWFLISFFFKY